jgi:hypothetical protein
MGSGSSIWLTGGRSSNEGARDPVINERPEDQGRAYPPPSGGCIDAHGCFVASRASVLAGNPVPPGKETKKRRALLGLPNIDGVLSEFRTQSVFVCDGS